MTNSEDCLYHILVYAIYAKSKTCKGSRTEERFIEACGILRVEFSTKASIKTAQSKGYELWDSIPENSPMVGINNQVYWNFRQNTKTEFEKVCLLGFLAFKSIIGDKAYCKTYNKYWLNRMAGNVKSEDIELLPDEIQKYATRKYTTKIKRELENEWGLKEYAYYTRGFYISFKLSIEDLVKHAENRRKSTKDKQRIKAKKDARNKFLQGGK